MINNELFKNKYRVKTTRLAEYDYSQPGYYFITVCTKDKAHCFGEIVDNKMTLNGVGKIIETCWLEIPKHFDNVSLDEFVIMPNHIHGIIIINEGRMCRDEAMPRLYNGEHPQMSAISPKPNSLPVIIGSFKSICVKIIRKSFPNTNFAWQPRFYDHIIRAERSYNGIQWYIQTNPERWDRDRNNPEGVFM